MVQLMQKFVPQSYVGIFRNERTQSTPFDLNSCFRPLHCVLVHLGSFRNCTKLDEKQGASKSRQDFFATNAPNPLRWTLNSCFGELHSVWVYLGSFRNCMKLGTKQCELVQLMQKFVPRRYVGIFLNECIQSAPLDPKLMFWGIA